MAYLRWQWRWRRAQFGPLNEPDVRWSAIIAESKRDKGKPTQRHIAYLVGFTESAIKIPAQRCHIWDRVTERLGELGDKITAADREKIEAAIAKRVPRPTSAEYKDIARGSAQRLGWDFLSKKQQAALQDEAEQWQNAEGESVKEIRQLFSGAKTESVRCSFCGKSAEQVDTIVWSPTSNICNECVESATTAIAKQKAKLRRESTNSTVGPERIPNLHEIQL